MKEDKAENILKNDKSHQSYNEYYYKEYSDPIIFKFFSLFHNLKTLKAIFNNNKREKIKFFPSQTVTNN